MSKVNMYQISEAQLELLQKALILSSPHTDSLYRWKDADWISMRKQAIEVAQNIAKTSTATGNDSAKKIDLKNAN